MGDSHSRDESTGALSSRLKLPLEPGDVLDGKYTITRLIGTGSMGFVFSAERPNLGDEVAIKVLRRDVVSDGQLLARFAREAQVAAAIKSEHVACVFDVGHLPGGAPFIVMERLEGKDLRWVLAEKGSLSIELAVDYALQACEALAVAHSHGITHRDIKPENLFASRQAQGDHICIKVLDFGISKMKEHGGIAKDRFPLVRTTMALGSPMYMSPEQLRAARDIDGRADIWGLGCVLYELLTGNPAFSAPSLTELCAMILENQPLGFTEAGVAVPPDLEAVVWRCLQKDPKRRFQTVGELAQALAPFAPSRSLISVERCCSVSRESTAGEESPLEVVFDDRFEAATLPAFLPPRPPFNWKRAIVVVSALVLAWGCGALLFAPHAEMPGSAAVQQETQLSATLPPPVDSIPVPTSEPEERGAPELPAAPPPAARASSPPVRPAVMKSKSRPAYQATGDELDVGF